MGRKSIDDNLRIKIALEAILKPESISELSKKYGLTKRTISKYKKMLLKNLSKDALPEGNCPLIEEQEKRIAHLEKIEKADSHKSEGGFFKRLHITSAKAEFCVAFVTLILAIFTCKMACHTKELADVYKNPRLNLHLLTESDFDLSFKKGIKFTVGDFQKNRQRVKFFLVVENKWASNIKDTIDFDFKISVFKDAPHRGVKSHRSKKYPISLGPDMMSPIYRLDEIHDKLIETNHANHKDDQFIKIKINETDVTVTHYPYAGINVKYWDYKKFNEKYGRFLDND